MKNYLIYVLIFSVCFLGKEPDLYAQTPTAMGSVIYQFHHVTDTTNPSHAWNEKMELSFYKNKGLYTSYSKREQAEAIRKNTQIAMEKGTNVVNMKASGRITTENIYTYLVEKERYTVKRFHLDNYIIKEALPAIHWKIQNETKKINGYDCQKATGICKGREYTAWFASDIPVSFGPWKLHGLPGLILEAYDNHLWISFTCVQVEVGKTDLTDANLAIPAGIKATQTEYFNMINASKLGIVGNIISGNGAQVNNVQITGISGGHVKNHSKRTENYPLELN